MYLVVTNPGTDEQLVVFETPSLEEAVREAQAYEEPLSIYKRDPEGRITKEI